MIRKVCVLGEPAVGKTSILRRLVHDRWEQSYLTTVGARVARKTCVLRPPGFSSDVRVKLLIWDVTGHDRFGTVYPYLRGTDAALVVGDATRIDTIVDLWKWVERVRAVSGDIPVTLMVNKADLVEGTFDFKLMEELAREYASPYRLTSAKTGSNVERCIQELGARLISRWNAGPTLGS